MRILVAEPEIGDSVLEEAVSKPEPDDSKPHDGVAMLRVGVAAANSVEPTPP
ncbi:hypothetical protein [Aurantimonas sp. 22II-16-19i]|uniref:hypothetical protein n=1 Tax=Aurantimonas sp. 22II-16-19i TaxID=1317114 RepID=UPI001592B6A0|nr:hypothetical protein [Aurantimonas sp. 22II-16-19i]